MEGQHTVRALIPYVFIFLNVKCEGLNGFFPFPVFKVENSENILQVQTVFYPAEKRGGKCTHIHTHIHLYCPQLYTVRTFIEMTCLM